ncbi:cysteine three histidine 1 [Pygocentrus nattereri]|uniref:mRNA decay activator protein ZFP36 n=1 Tax=Pygocentrus nattereri TaxID=42514 RepID=A0A3B4C8S2_PYGNA|nr:cysteine three histidine 1 [Pygocentrus nattereri]
MFETSQDDLLLFPSDGGYEVCFPGESLANRGQSLAEALLPLVGSPSPPLNPLLCSTRYKTELCSRYAETGTCKYAERCQFAHGLHDLHVPSHHPKYKTELCRTFHTAGYCMYGTRCLFVHSLKEQRPVRHRRRSVPCRTYRAFGVCPFGTRCHFLHVEGGSESSDGAEEKTWQPPSRSSEWKPRGALCRTFSSFGFCLYGTRCRFQHGLPNNVKGLDLNQTPWSPQMPGRALSPASDMCSSSPPSSSTSSSPPSMLASPVFRDYSGPITPPSGEAIAHNAFTFSSQHLNDLLLPLAIRLQQLEQASNLNPQDVLEQALLS